MNRIVSILNNATPSPDDNIRVFEDANDEAFAIVAEARENHSTDFDGYALIVDEKGDEWSVAPYTGLKQIVFYRT